MRVRGETAFVFLLMLIFGAGTFLSVNWSTAARLLPLTVAALGAVLSVGLLLSNLAHAPGKEEEQQPEEQELTEHTESEKTKSKVTTRSEVTIIFWLFAFLGLILITGFWVAIAGFLPIFLLLFGRENVKTAVIFTVCVWVVVYGVFHIGLGMPLYGGVLGLSFL